MSKKDLVLDIYAYKGLVQRLERENELLKDALNSIRWAVDGEVDIKNNGSPNTAMKVETIISQTLEQLA
jgi:hypothetical protein